jgi:hypothetical protein
VWAYAVRFRRPKRGKPIQARAAHEYLNVRLTNQEVSLSVGLALL